jgi:hypothetical protein
MGESVEWKESTNAIKYAVAVIETHISKDVAM